MNNMKKSVTYIFLHVMLIFYSLSGVCSKKAATAVFFSKEFCIYYSGVLFLLVGYAICWQQIIKRIPLTVAFSNKAVTIVWGMIWGIIFFGERITLGKLMGALLVVFGVIMYSCVDNENGGNND